MASSSSELSILHADLDAFFAAVEVLDDPSLAGKPLIIGHPGRRGVVSTASYEARQFGVHSALPSVEAMRRCPTGVWRQPRGRRYAAISRDVMEVFRSFTPEVEPLSLDEAFLDVSGSRRLFGNAIEIAEAIRRDVRAKTGLVVSIGVAENKFLAKVASDVDKPDGLTVVPFGGAEEFLAPLPIRRLWGVGPRTAERLGALGLKTIADVQKLEADFLVRTLGEQTGLHLHRLSHGLDRRQVENGRAAKSISTESTFENDLRDRDEIEDFLFCAATEVGRSLRKDGWLAKTVGLKVRTGSFRTMTRSHTLDHPTDLGEVFYHCAVGMLRDRIELGGEGVRLLGVGASGLVREDSPRQRGLFEPPEDAPSAESERLVDRILAAQGARSIGPARLLLRTPHDPDRIERVEAERRKSEQRRAAEPLPDRTGPPTERSRGAPPPPPHD